MRSKIKLLIIAGARPNFMKVAPLIRRIRAQDFEGGATLEYRLVHTGQHYDEKMSGVFFQELGIPLPDINLDRPVRSQMAMTDQPDLLQHPVDHHSLINLKRPV